MTYAGVILFSYVVFSGPVTFTTERFESGVSVEDCETMATVIRQKGERFGAFCVPITIANQIPAMKDQK